MSRIQPLTEKEEKMLSLQYQELEIQAELKKDIPVRDGELDFREYDELHAQLRAVHAEMTTLI